MPKPKLTPEEKKARKAEIKAEKKRKLAEKKKQLQRDRLDRELNYSQITLRKQEKNWKKMLIDISLPEMRKDLEFAWHNFERVIDCKDFQISLLLDELDKANQQYFFNLNSHAEHIDQLIQMFADRMNELHEDYQSQAQELQTNYQEDCVKLNKDTSEEENYLKTMLYILQREMRDVKRTRHAEYFSKLEEEDSKQGQLVQRIKGLLEGVHLQIWTDTVQFLNEHKNKIKDRKKTHNELRTEDNALQKVIRKQLDHIRNAYNMIRDLKLKKTELQKFLGRKVADLQSEFDFFSYAFSTLKSKLAEDRNIDFQKLNCLTVNYNETISYLETLQTKGKHILHVGAVCRKLETLEEKILPFPVNYFGDMIKPDVENIPEYMECLELFWQRVGKADASRYAVNEEREFLITENEILKRRLHYYCQCLKCPDYEPFKTKTCFTVTEGVLELKKYNKHKVLNDKFETESDDFASDDWDKVFNR